MHKFWNELGHLRRGMWQTRHTPGQVLIKPQDGWNRPTGWNVKGPAIRAWGQYHSRVIPLPSIGSTGGECGLLRRRHSGKGRAVPERLPVDP